MSAADEAYEAAERLIAEAKADGREKLDFDEERFRALEVIPPEIGALSAVREIDLDQTSVTDLTPLSGLSGLTELWLNQTSVTDLSPLSGLSGLKSLGLDQTYVTDLSPLSELSGLRELRLDQTSVTDLSPLSGLSGLTELRLNRTSVTDLSPLSGLSGLKSLGLNRTSVTDLSPLSGLSGLTELWLEQTSVTDLSPLSGLSGLEWLSLNQTSVADLTPLSGLSGLTDLWLDGCAAVDLRPLRGLHKLVDDPSEFLGGLSFQDSGAAQADRRIAEIAEIADDYKRARVLFDYLEDWVPSGEGDATPKPDPAFPVETVGEQLEVAASCPTAEEQEDALKRAMHKALPGMLRRLADAAGNQFPKLCYLARRVQAQVEVPFEEVDMPALHLAMNELRAAEASGAEEGMDFNAPLKAILSSVNDAGGGLTMDHPLVVLLMERARKARENPDPEDDRAAQDRMSRAVAGDAEAMGDRLRALEDRVAGSEDLQAREAQKAVNRNVLWKVAMWGGGAVGSALVGAGVTEFMWPPLLTFVKVNLPVLLEVAATYGGAFANWFATSIARLPGMDVLIREWRRKR